MIEICRNVHSGHVLNMQKYAFLVDLCKMKFGFPSSEFHKLYRYMEYAPLSQIQKNMHLIFLEALQITDNDFSEQWRLYVFKSQIPTPKLGKIKAGHIKNMLYLTYTKDNGVSKQKFEVFNRNKM